jgi:hypothetical protein
LPKFQQFDGPGHKMGHSFEKTLWDYCFNRFSDPHRLYADPILDPAFWAISDLYRYPACKVNGYADPNLG